MWSGLIARVYELSYDFKVILSTISKLDELKDCIDKFDDVEWSFNYKAVFNHNFSEIATDKDFVSRFKDFIEKEKLGLNEEFENL